MIRFLHFIVSLFMPTEAPSLWDHRSITQAVEYFADRVVFGKTRLRTVGARVSNPGLRRLENVCVLILIRKPRQEFSIDDILDVRWLFQLISRRLNSIAITSQESRDTHLPIEWQYQTTSPLLKPLKYPSESGISTDGMSSKLSVPEHSVALIARLKWWDKTMRALEESSYSAFSDISYRDLPSFKSRIRKLSRPHLVLHAKQSERRCMLDTISELSYSEPSSITVACENSIPWIDRARNYIDSMSKAEWDWWPLGAANKSLSLGPVKLEWKSVSIPSRASMI